MDTELSVVLRPSSSAATTFLKGQEMISTSPGPEQDHQDAHAVALFATLLASRKRNDFHEAARACDELDRLGFRVKLPRRPRNVA